MLKKNIDSTKWLMEFRTDAFSSFVIEITIIGEIISTVGIIIWKIFHLILILSISYAPEKNITAKPIIMIQMKQFSWCGTIASYLIFDDSLKYLRSVAVIIPVASKIISNPQ